MTDVMVDSERMRRTTMRARDKLAEVQRAAGALKAHIDELNGTWTGGNHDEFVEDFNRSYEAMRALQQGVERYLEGIEAAAEEYDRADADLLGMARKVLA